jgi:hypothetical protein
MAPSTAASPAVIRGGDLSRIRVPDGCQDRLQLFQRNVRALTAALLVWSDMAVAPKLPDPALGASLANTKQLRNRRVRADPALVRFDNSLSQFNRMGFSHADYRSNIDPASKQDRLS